MRGVLKMIHNGYDISHIDLMTEHKTACPSCKDTGGDWDDDNLHVYGVDEHGKVGGFRCFACGYRMSSDQWKEENGGKLIGNNGVRGLTVLEKDVKKFNEKKLTPEQLEEIHNRTDDTLRCKYRGLDPVICHQEGVRWVYDRDGKVKEMYFPAKYLVDGKEQISGYKVRTTPKGFYSIGYVGKMNLMIGQTSRVTEKLIITAGEIDYLSALSIRNGLKKYNQHVNIVSSLLGEDSTADCLRNQFEWVDKHSAIISALDNDDAGNKAFEKIKELISNDKLFKANLQKEDVNDYFRYGIQDQLAQDIYWKPVPVEDYGIIGSGQLLAKARERLSQDKIPFPKFLSDLAEHFTDNAMWTGEWMNWISSISSGKSTVMDAWMVDWALNAPYRQAVMSYESDATSFGVKIASLATTRSVMKIEGKENRLNFLDENEDKINHLIKTEDGQDRFDFIDTLPTSIDHAKKMIMYLVKVRKVRIIWIDPLLDFLSLCKTKPEYDDLILFLDQVRMKYHVNIMTALHTRKNLSSGENGSGGGEINEEDAYGGREVTAKGTINITARRNKNATDWIERNTMILNIRKSRNDQVTGVETKLFYRAKANKLYPYSYAESKKFFVEDFDKSVEDIVIDDDVGFGLQHVGVDNFDEVVVDDAEYVDESKADW